MLDACSLLASISASMAFSAVLRRYLDMSQAGGVSWPGPAGPGGFEGVWDWLTALTNLEHLAMSLLLVDDVDTSPLASLLRLKYAAVRFELHVEQEKGLLWLNGWVASLPHCGQVLGPEQLSAGDVTAVPDVAVDAHCVAVPRPRHQLRIRFHGLVVRERDQCAHPDVDYDVNCAYVCVPCERCCPVGHLPGKG